MNEEKLCRAVRAGVIVGVAAGFCLGCAVWLAADGLGLSASIFALQPVVYTLGIVPLIGFVWGVQMFKKVKAAE